MNQEENRLQCAACTEPETSKIIHTVRNDGVLRRLCTDCLLKENRQLFCPFCLEAFDEDDVPPPHGRIVCGKCPSITHLACSPPPSSSSSSVFTCPPCSDPNFSFFPKSDGNGAGTRIDTESAKAFVAAAEIAAGSLNKGVAVLKEGLLKKIVDAQVAKKKAKEALENLQELVIKQKASENRNPSVKRKNDER